MAVIPNPSGIARETPRNRAGLQEEARLDYRGEQADIALTGEIGKLGEKAFQVADHLSSVKARDGVNSLIDAEQELGIDLRTQTGALSTTDLLTKYGDKYKENVKTISEKIGGIAGSKFESLAIAREQRFKAELINFQGVEQKKYTELVHKTGNEKRMQEAYVATTDLTLGAVVTGQAEATAKHLNVSLGVALSDDDISKLPKEQQEAATKARTERTATMLTLTQEDKGLVALKAVEGAINRGDLGRAGEIIKKYGSAMTSKQYEHAQKILKPNVDYQKGNDALAAFNAGKLTEEEIKNSSSKEVYTTFKQLQTIDKTNKKEADVEQVGTFMAAFYENKSDGLRYAAKNIYSNPKFLALSGVSQAAIRSRIDNEIGPDSAASQTKLMNSGMGRYLELSESLDLAAMSPGKLNFERQNIGNTLVNQLLIQQKAIKTGAAQDKIDPALIKDAMTPEIAKNKDKSAAFNGFIVYKFRKWQGENPNQKLDLEGKRQLIASAYNESVVPGGGFIWGDKVTPAYQDTKDAIPDAMYKAMTGTDKSKIEFYNKAKGLGMSETAIMKAIAWENNKKKVSVEKSSSATKVPAQPKSFSETPIEQSDLVKSIPK